MTTDSREYRLKETFANTVNINRSYLETAQLGSSGTEGQHLATIEENHNQFKHQKPIYPVSTSNYSRTEAE